MAKETPLLAIFALSVETTKGMRGHSVEKRNAGFILVGIDLDLDDDAGCLVPHRFQETESERNRFLDEDGVAEERPDY
ncbi:hypothetical protein V6N13_057053 [Hibiscus sabdariffa]